MVSVYSRCYLETRNYHHLRVGMSGSMLAFFFPLNWMFYLTVKNLSIHHFKSASYASGRFPKWLSGWYRICLPSRRHMFDRWVRKDPLEKEMAAHSSILVWEIPWTEEPGAYSPWNRRVRHAWETECSTTYIMADPWCHVVSSSPELSPCFTETLCPLISNSSLSPDNGNHKAIEQMT